MEPTDLTVAALVERDGQYLIVEETADGIAVLTQPGGHLETDESPEAAVRREVFEETACDVTVGDLIGVYLWIHPQTRRQYRRIVFLAELVEQRNRPPPDAKIHAVRWYSRADLERRRPQLRSPTVLRCIDDYVAGERRPRTLFRNCHPLQRHIDTVLARAALL
ncbi:MAG: NUDIX domain-containing protein [Woeseiaceae bacterium]|nr:NUDIX domain-containing protein [Woeseiaceae bacterium]